MATEAQTAADLELTAVEHALMQFGTNEGRVDDHSISPAGPMPHHLEDGMQSTASRSQLSGVHALVSAAAVNTVAGATCKLSPLGTDVDDDRGVHADLLGGLLPDRLDACLQFAQRGQLRLRVGRLV